MFKINPIKQKGISSWIFIFLFVLAAFSATAQVSEIGPGRLKVNLDGNILQIPYYANFRLDSLDNGIRKAIIIIHGMNRNAGDYYHNMREAASMSTYYTDSLLIIAPQFLEQDDLHALHLNASFLYWSDGWKSGSKSKDRSSDPRPARISSYSILDTLMMRLAIYHPNLKYIVFAGHSAGGQLTNRYSASSPIVNTLCEDYGISTRFIVANPSSYLYLDNKRVVSGTVDQFAVPTAACSGFNDWRYGLDNLYSYPGQFGADSIRQMFKKREVVYLLGGKDTDENSSSLDQSCMAELQGKNRLERGTIYYNYLKYYYGNDITETQKIDTVPGVGHDNHDMFTSAKGRYWLFMTDPTSCNRQPTAVKPVYKEQLIVYPNPTKGSIHIKLKNDNPGITYYFIYDTKGNIVMRHQIFNGNSSVLNLKKLAPGIYLLLINNKNETIREVICKL